MIFVRSFDKTTEEPLTNIQTDFKMEQSTEGSMTVSFSTNSHDNPGYDILKTESTVNIDGFDFKIKSCEDNGSHKKVSGTSEFFELSKTRTHDMLGGTKTLGERLDFVLAGTEWTAEIDPLLVDDHKLIANFGNDNIVKLIGIICEHHEIEYEIRRDKTLYFTKEVGGDNDHQYRYRNNLSGVLLVEDSSELFTVVSGKGKNGIRATYRSPNADIFGELEAEPMTNEDIESEQELGLWLSKQITDIPKVAIESDAVDLIDRETGEKVWLIYEPLNITMKTRIIKQTKVLRGGKLVTDKVVLGNVVPRTLTDVMIEQYIQIDTNNKQNRSLFEQTNDRITMEVETIGSDIARFEMTSQQIIQTVEDLEADAYSAIVQTASDIRAEVTQLDTKLDTEIGTVTTNYQSMINQTAQGIRADVAGSVTAINGRLSTVENSQASVVQTSNSLNLSVQTLTTKVNGHDSQISSAQSSISVLSSGISQKAEKSDLQGNKLIAEINLQPSTIKIAAKNIDLQGTVSVLDNNIYLKGTTPQRGIYFDQYGYSGRITSTNTGMVVASDNLELSSALGNIGVYAYSFDLECDNIEGVVGTSHPNFYIAWNGAKRVYFRSGGKTSAYNVGYVDLV